jgi:hypothetical protein
VAILVCFGLRWAPAPFSVVFAVVSRGETEIWLGDLRVVCRFAFLFFVLLFYLSCPRNFSMEPLRFILSL